LRGTKLGDSPVKHVQVIEEIDGYQMKMGKRCEIRYEGYSPCTANHSFVSSPSGSWTANRRFPEPYAHPELDPSAHHGLNNVNIRGWPQRTFVVDTVSSLLGCPS